MDVERLRSGLVYIVALVLSICVHEFGHAFVADRLGDRLPRSQGRVTLNPLVHIDPIGSLLLPLIAIVSGAGVIGWGRPVQLSLSPRDMTRKLSIRTSHALIAIAGPAMNILFALVLSGVLFGLLRWNDGPNRLVFANGVAQVIFMNITLCLFNLLPIPPLDGGAVLRRIVPQGLGRYVDKLNQYGFIILLALMVTGALGTLLWPARVVGDAWLKTVTQLAAIR
jgi:Zn-dependent protease